MAGRTYGPEEQAKLKRIIDEGANVLSEVEDLNTGLKDTVKAVAEELEINLLKNPYLTGEVKNLKEGIYKPDTYFFKYGYPRVKLLAKMKIAQDNLLDIIWKEKPKDFINLFHFIHLE